MSWDIEFLASNKVKAKAVLADLVNKGSLPTRIEDLISSLVDQLAVPTSIARRTVINIKSWGQIGTGSATPNIHIDVKTVTLDWAY